MNTQNTATTATTATDEIEMIPLSPADVAHLIDNQGMFVNGYDDDAINSVLGNFETARLVCLWAYYDDYGYGGDSEFFGVAKVADPAYTHLHANATKDEGPWRQVHPDVWSYLSDPDSDIDPANIPCLLVATTEHAPQNINDLGGDGFANVATENKTETDEDDDEDDEETCVDDDCDESLEDGEGFDGYCGNHADKIEGHNEGRHRPVGEKDDEGDDANGPDDECPNCGGAGIVWG